jgi:hypothetical protein
MSRQTRIIIGLSIGVIGLIWVLPPLPWSSAPTSSPREAPRAMPPPPIPQVADTPPPQEESTAAVLPPFNGELNGNNEVRVKNPGDSAVQVGLRSGSRGQDFQVSAAGVHSIYVPDGNYDIYFIYAKDRESLYQGDSFALANNGVQITLVQVVEGNYNVRKVN